MEWTNEKLLNFIKDYRKCKVLWDIRNPNYNKHNIKKRKILIAFGQKYGMDEGSVRKKIKNLRSAFHREHHRLTSKMKDESDDVRKWFAYDALKFILDVTGPYMTKREEQSNSAEESFQEEDYDIDLQEPFDISTQYIQLMDESPERSKSPDKQKSLVTSNEEDEYDLFGRSMTMQLRKMPELVALDLMQKMQLMVFNAKKQLNKVKNKKQVKIPQPVSHSVPSTSKERIRSPSPLSHKSSPRSSPMYKFEAISPDETCAEDNADKDFYEYMITVEDDKLGCEGINKNASNELKQQLKRKSLKPIDPLEVKRIKD
ncbi:uncharacterized protein LOC134653107 [Cydia amplana]|uniref:uncharacterized protein LOC134653107 n=1 Tax=Cydia amplana TaxID=1869771 RepID=UPI002FE509FD